MESESASESAKSHSVSAYPYIVQGNYFKIVSNDCGKIIAKCTACPNKHISGAMNATSNFLRHLKKIHPSLLFEYESQKPTKTPKGTASPKGDATSSKRLKQQCIISSMNTSISQSNLENLILNYIIGEMRPLSTIEKPPFIALIRALAPSHSLPTRKTLSARLKHKFSLMKEKLREVLRDVNHVCTTADIWSSRNKSYFGMTAHWIAGMANNFQRESAAIGCRRLKGSHTYDVIAEAIGDIHREYDLSTSKIVSTITDNASNFKKAFLVYAVDSDSDNEDEEDELHFHSISDVLSNGDSDCYLPQLPPQEKCAAHTLNLIATTDAERASKDKKYERLSTSAFSKCSAIWNTFGRSTKASDCIKDISNKSLIIPCRTRWNSMYDAVSQLVVLEEKLHEICDGLHLPRFKSCELEFLKEYVLVMRPIADTLDTLQGEKMCYYGMFLPKLVHLRKVLMSTSETNLQHTSPLVQALLNGLEHRYSHMYSFAPSATKAIVAAVSHPYYKLRWVQPEKREDITTMFTSVVLQNYCGDESLVSQDDDYGFSDSSSDFRSDHKAKIEVMSYLNNHSKELSMLSLYPSICKIFIMYNTTLPSSAPVERLFSCAGHILLPNRNRLSDANFEKLLMLKANYKHCT